MDVNIPYENVGKIEFGHIWRPIAKVTLKSPANRYWINLWMIVDSGADYTIIPRHFSQKLRISLEHDCIKDETSGVGGSQIVYFLKAKIQARLNHFERKIPLAFFDNNEVPALLGRLGFLETFNTEFLKSHEVVFRD